MSDIKTKWLFSSQFRAMTSGSYYSSTEKFFEDLEKGSLKEGFILAENLYLELVERLNQGDKKLAQQITDNGILIVINAASKSEINGLIELAEVCREG